MYLFTGLQMWMNMKPYTTQPFSPKSVMYTLGISTASNLIDQKRNTIQIIPGHKISIRVLPRIVTSTPSFDALEPRVRNCKLPHEIDGFVYLLKYTRIGCEFECAAGFATHSCKCIPWYYPNNFTYWAMCDMFGGNCFDSIMSDETFYKKCPLQCLEDCQEMALTVLPSVTPLNIDNVCKEGSFAYQHLQHKFKQHFAFQNYKILAQQGSIPDLARSFANGSLCKTFVEDYVSFVSVESPTTSVIMSEKDQKVSFYDQLGTIGGTLGLFTGMSALSMIEVVFLIVNLVKHLIQKCTPDQFRKHVDKNRKNGDQENVNEFDPKKSINTNGSQLCENCNDEAKNKIEVSPSSFYIRIQPILISMICFF